MISAKPAVLVVMLALAGGTVAQEPPDDQRTAELIVEELKQVEQHIRSAKALMDEGKLVEAGAALNEAHQALTAAKQVLGNLGEGRDNEQAAAQEEESRFKEWAILVGMPVGWVAGAWFRGWLDKHPHADAAYKALLRLTGGRRK